MTSASDLARSRIGEAKALVHKVRLKKRGLAERVVFLEWEVINHMAPQKGYISSIYECICICMYVM